MNKFGPDHLAAFICPHVYENSKPILLVSHDENGDWQFLCGGDHDVNEEPRVVGIIHLLERDPSLNEIADLPIHWEAERNAVGGEWIRTKSEERIW